MWTGALAAADLGSTACGINKSSWRRSPLALPYSCPAHDPQTGEQLYQRSSHTIGKVLRPTTDSPAWGSGKGTENPQGIWLWNPVGFDYRTFTGLGKQRLLEGHKQNLVHTRTQEKGAVTPQETEAGLLVSLQESPAEVWVDRGLLRGRDTDYNSPFGCWVLGELRFLIKDISSFFLQNSSFREKIPFSIL